MSGGRSILSLGGIAVSADGTIKRAGTSLPWLFALYAAATLLHFAHNAEYLAQYPNLPASWSRADVYAAWCCVMALGILGFGLYTVQHRKVGLMILGAYATLGFAGLLHYTRAPMADHSGMMNVTIWCEAAAGTLLLANVVLLSRAASSLSPPNNGWRGP